jgi:hypothetical protein
LLLAAAVSFLVPVMAEEGRSAALTAAAEVMAEQQRSSTPTAAAMAEEGRSTTPTAAADMSGRLALLRARRDSFQSGPSPLEQVRVANAGLQRAKELGDDAKTKGQIDQLARKWTRYIAMRREAAGDIEPFSQPTVELVRVFLSHCFHHRDNRSIARPALKGMGASFELQARYFLAKRVFVFVQLRYGGWFDLNESALNEKAQVYKEAIRETWRRLVTSSASPEANATGETCDLE